MVCYDHSYYKLLFVYPSTDAMNANASLVDWCAVFGSPKSLMSDYPTHVKSETILPLSKFLHIKQHFSLLYTPCGFMVSLNVWERVS